MKERKKHRQRSSFLGRGEQPLLQQQEQQLLLQREQLQLQCMQKLQQMKTLNPNTQHVNPKP